MRSIEKRKERKKTQRKSEKAREKFLVGTEAPEAPMKPKNAQALFCEDKKAELLKADPKLGLREVSKRCAALWSSLDADERERFESKAKSMREVYEFELAAYKDTPAYKAYERAAGLIDRGRGRGRGSGRGRKRKSDDDDFLAASGLFDDSDDLGLGDSDGMGLDSDESI